jgi:hypothetical protein
MEAPEHNATCGESCACPVPTEKVEQPAPPVPYTGKTAMREAFENIVAPRARSRTVGKILRSLRTHRGTFVAHGTNRAPNREEIAACNQLRIKR